MPPSPKDGVVVPTVPGRLKQEEFEFVKDFKRHEWNYCALVKNDARMDETAFGRGLRLNTPLFAKRRAEAWTSSWKSVAMLAGAPSYTLRSDLLVYFEVEPQISRSRQFYPIYAGFQRL